MSRRRDPKAVVGFLVENRRGETYFAFDRAEVVDLVNSFEQDAWDWDEEAFEAPVIPLTKYSAGEKCDLRKLRDFVKHVAKLHNDPKARKGKRWDILSDVLNAVVGEAQELVQLQKKGKKR